MTLAFLGRRPVEEAGPIWQAARAAVTPAAAPLLAPRELVAVPPRRPRLWAVDLEDDEGRAGRVHEAVNAALAAAGLHEPEERPFWPHVTVARVRRGGRSRAARARPPDEPLRVVALTLFRSDLYPTGARYAALDRLDLAPG